MRRFYAVLIATISLLTCGNAADYDVLIRNGTVYDGSGSAPVSADVGVTDDRIAAVGDLSEKRGATEIDAEGLAVAPEFINMLSWATTSLIEDGRSLSDIMQGVTLEVMGEGSSEGPLNEAMKKNVKDSQGDIKFDVEWTTLGEYLEFLEKRGVSPNVASFAGHTTLRVHEIGYEDRAPEPEELDRMKALLRQAMEEGAMGLSTALIYTPAFYADTDEIVELAKVAVEYDGLYISHLRSEGNRFLEALDEFMQIVSEAGIRGEVYHFKTAGMSNWDKLDAAIARIEEARDDGIAVTADMYTYTAGATGLNAAMPPWVQEGGYERWAARLQDPEIRRRVMREMRTPTDEWENLLLASGPDKTLLVNFKNEKLRHLTGKTLAEVAEIRGTSPEEAAIDLVIEDSSRVGTVYFMMSEENVKKKIRQPWMSFCSDAGSIAPEGVFLNSNPHPRAYGSFARLLGKYVREETVIPLEEAVRRLTSLPAKNLKIADRGVIKDGYYADIAIFDPQEIGDTATYDEPHRLAAGMRHVLVNGVPVVLNGEHTGAAPGRVVRGPGWTGSRHSPE